MTRRIAGRWSVALGAALWLMASLPGAVAAADVEFGTPTASSTFETGVEFTQPVTLASPASRVELLISTADAIGPLVIEVPRPEGSGERTLRSSLDPAGDGHMLPNTPMRAQWRVTLEGADEGVLGPEVDVVYRDDRFEWQTVEGDVVRVHWYEGDAAFGERALRIGEEAVAETSALLGVTEDEPVDFFIYPEQQPFYEALGPGTRENVGGQANADIRTLFALISPNQIDDPWVEVVVPHELVHLVFDTAVSNPYHFPPRWLNEGLATYQSEGYGAGYRNEVEAAVRDGSLIPLEGLVGQFPTTQDRFFLAYAESVSAVDFFIRTHDQDALVALINSYADGRTDDEAFTDATGADVAAFEAAWLADLGAEPPERFGPQEAPAGPLPSAWGEGAGASPPPAGASAGAGSSADPGAPAAPIDPTGTDDGGTAPALLVLGGLLLVAVVAVVLWRRRSRPEAHPAGLGGATDGPGGATQGPGPATDGPGGATDGPA
jgi:hypothetical protein